MTVSLFSARANESAHVLSDMCARVALGDVTILSRFGSRASVGGLAPGVAKWNSLLKPGWLVVATNVATQTRVELGFIEEDAAPRQLTDVALADGLYEIEVWSADFFWCCVRTEKVATLYATIVGGGSTIVGLPAIRNLRSNVSGARSRIRWEIVEDYAPTLTGFGVWYSAITPVVVTGPPDEVIPFRDGVGAYFAYRTHTAPEYAAVASINATEQGVESEVLMNWELVAEDSPPDQVAL